MTQKKRGDPDTFQHKEKTMTKKISTAVIAGLGALALATPAAAHLDPAQHGSVAAGFSHPLFGLDHILAMVAVGLWALMLGGRALWAVPSAFVVMMAVGFGLAGTGFALPMVEPMILASVMVLGLVIALAARMSTSAGMAIVGLFAVFHGYAHGGEMGAATPMGYMLGFLAGTALLHGAGLALGFGAARLGARHALVQRIAGGAVALAGAGLAFGAL